MRALWARCAGGPMSADDFAAALLTVSGRHFDQEIASWVHGKSELPLQELLTQHGISVHEEPAQLAQQLGMRVSESQGIVVKTVLRGGAAESAGFAAGDEWLGVELAPPGKVAAATNTGWRLSRLDDLLLYTGAHRKLFALVARDKRLLRLALTLPEKVCTWRLAITDTVLLTRWLNGTD
jgi:predicted metalloprotease with PDZ domain